MARGQNKITSNEDGFIFHSSLQRRVAVKLHFLVIDSVIYPRYLHYISPYR